MVMTASALTAACLLDLAVGDPRWLPHPVRAMGRAIGWYEGVIRRRVGSPGALRWAGVLLAAGLPVVAYGLGWLAIEVAGWVHPTVRWLTIVWLALTTLAGRDLVDHVRMVLGELSAGRVPGAQEAVGHIVGRDTERLTEPEVVRATVETVAESTADGVIAPLVYLTLGGPPLALAFKAVSTLDSMIGHRDERYRDFGWASARLDDLANWIPARMTAGLFVLAAAVVTQRSGPAWRILCRDGGRHPSPNSGRPEAAMAGALGVQLGGINWYDGQPSVRPLLGDKESDLTVGHIRTSLSMMGVATAMAVALMLLVVVMR